MSQALIDTCFLNRFKDGVSLSKDFHLIMNEMDYELVLHPYVVENELDMYSYVEKYIEQGLFVVPTYDSIFTSESFKRYYSSEFITIYNIFYDRLKIINPHKAEKMHRLAADTDVFSYRYSGSSMGDVHMVMLAAFLEIPIILSDDNKDMGIIYNIAITRINRDKYTLRVLKVADVIDEIEKKEDCNISHKDLKRIRRYIIG